MNPNSLYRVDHPAKNSIAIGSNVTEAIELMGEPYDRTPNETGGQTLLYRTMTNWDKFVEFKTLTIETDENGTIESVKSANDE